MRGCTPSLSIYVCSLATNEVAYLNLKGRDIAKPAVSHSSSYAGITAEDTGELWNCTPGWVKVHGLKTALSKMPTH